MHIYQLTNHNGNPWTNQVVVDFDKLHIKILQSYNSKVCMIDTNEDHITLGDDWDYSRTTMKAVKKFLEDNLGGSWNASDIRQALKEGHITQPYGYDLVRDYTVANGCDDFFNDFFTINEH